MLENLENRMIRDCDMEYKTLNYEEYYENLAIRDDMIYEDKVNEELERREKN